MKIRQRLVLFSLGLIVLAPISQSWAASPMAEAQAEVKSYSQAFSQNPENWQALLFRGNAYSKMGQNGAALRDYNYILERNPNYLDAYKRRGMLFEKMKQWDKAIDNYTSMIEMHPRYDLGYMLRANVFVQKQKIAQAMDDYASAARRNPQNGIAWFKRANLFYKYQNYQQALTEFRLAAQAQPTLLLAYEKQALCAFHLQDDASYIQALNQILAISPINPEYHLYRAKAYLKLNQHKEAFADLNDAIEQDKNMAEAYFLRSEYHREMQMCSQSHQDLRKACKLGFGKACKPVKKCVVKPVDKNMSKMMEPATPNNSSPTQTRSVSAKTAPVQTSPNSAGSGDSLPPAQRQAPPAAAKP
jgi:tetratricopeptide (TPR) repeat protein